MNYSASNTSLWGGILQISIICVVILFAHFIKRVFPFIKKVRMPTAVLAGFILLVVKIILKQFSITFLNMDFMELLTYHGIAIGFIAMSLRDNCRKIPEISGVKKRSCNSRFIHDSRCNRINNIPCFVIYVYAGSF